MKDPDRYFNWYKGYTQIGYPYYSIRTNELVTKIYTTATTGNISTIYFGQKFDGKNLDEHIYNLIQIELPEKFYWDYLGKIGMVFDIEKTTLSDSDVEFIEFNANEVKIIDAGVKHFQKNFTKASVREVKIRH